MRLYFNLKPTLIPKFVFNQQYYLTSDICVKFAYKQLILVLNAKDSVNDNIVLSNFKFVNHFTSFIKHVYFPHSRRMPRSGMAEL